MLILPKILLKRSFKRPMYLIILLLIPCFILLLHSFHRSDSAMIRVAIYNEAEDSIINRNLTESLLSRSTNLLEFFMVEDEEDLKHTIADELADVGILLPADLEDSLAEGDSIELVSILQSPSSLSAPFIREIISSELFELSSTRIFQDYISEKYPENVNESFLAQLAELFQEERRPSVFFTFQYINGEENTFLNESESNYYMLPARGMLSLLIFVAGFYAVLMLCEDKEKGLWIWIRRTDLPLFHYLFLFITSIPVAILSIFSILCTGIGIGILKESLLMLSYILLLCGYLNLLRILLKNRYLLLSLLPILLMVMFAFSGVFVQMARYLSITRIIQLLLPNSYYLNAIYSNTARWLLLGTGLLLSIVSIALDRILIERS